LDPAPATTNFIGSPVQFCCPGIFYNSGGASTNIKHELPDLVLPDVHIDLRFLARRVCLIGGQKQIGRELGIARGAEVASVAGEAPPILWNEYTRGGLQAPRLLLEYNAADIRGMKQILDVCVGRLLRTYGFPLDRFPQPNFLEHSQTRAKPVAGGWKALVASQSDT